jgi:hypothetical protein
MDDSPLLLPVPAQPLDRIHAFARDLAYGALLGHWKPGLTVINYGAFSPDAEEFSLHGPYNEATLEALMQKWQQSRPSFENLRAFEYLTQDETASGQSVYYLTRQAFRLLEQPLTPPTVFISYRRGTGSAFGLAIEYRLEARGIRPFIDRSLEGGDEWRRVLETRVQQSRFFVSILNEEALESPNVRDEINWALASQTLIIPIWHEAFDTAVLKKHNLEKLAGFNAILVMGDRAEDYHNAVEKLLNRLGYANTGL